MIGVGFTGGTVNVGPSFSNSKSSNTGKVAFVDIDGDGLPDKLFKQGNKLFYRKNMSADGKDLLFGKALPIRGVNSFSEGNSISRSLNADAAVEVGITKKLGASVGISYTHSKDQDKTTTYLYDFNSDGLTDIAVNGQVYFNHIVDGKPVFSPASNVTANPIIGEGSPIDKHFIPDYKVIRDSLEKEYPLNDAVRMWCAPFAGKVNIQSTIKKLSNQGDGIIYSIQHENNGFMVRDSLLQAGSKTNNLNCDVKVGDRIFFRLQSRYDGEDDRVLWNPIITYISLPVGKDRYLSEDLKTYNSKADYIEGENNVAIFNRTGKVTLHAPYMKGKTSDDVTLIVTRLDQHGETIVKRLKLPADSVVNGSYDYTDDH